MWLVWDAFKELSRSRTSNGYGLNSFAYAEILAWKTLTNSDITSKDINVLKMLDNMYLAHSAKSQPKSNSE